MKTSSEYGLVKQANGKYAYEGANDNHIKIMRDYISSSVQFKAAGGIRTLDDFLRVRAMGVTRIGATATENIL